MNEQPKNERTAQRGSPHVQELDLGSPADAEQDERKPTESGKKAADSTRSSPKESK